MKLSQYITYLNGRDDRINILLLKSIHIHMYNFENLQSFVAYKLFIELLKLRNLQKIDQFSFREIYIIYRANVSINNDIKCGNDIVGVV